MAGVRFSSPPLGQYDPDAGLGYDEDDLHDLHDGDASEGGDAGMDVDDDAGSMVGLGDYDSVYSRFTVFMPAVQSLVNAIGGYETVDDIRPDGSTGIKTVYRPGDSVLAVLKDLKRLWRKDDTDDERTVARCMAQAGLMRELTNLLVECFDRGEWGRKVSLVACDLIAALTWPIDVQSELKEMADEPDVVTDYATLLRAQVQYKAILLQTNRPLRAMLALMLPSLAKHRKEERDEQVISLGLHIVRNLLSIKDVVASGTSTGNQQEFAHLQSTLITQLDSLTYFKLFLTMAAGADRPEFNTFNVLILDILYLVFRGTKARELSLNQDRAPMNKLAELLNDEGRQKNQKSRNGMTRHSRFGTTLTVRAGDQKLVLHKQNAITVNAGAILDDIKKKRAGKLKKADELSRPVELLPEALKALQSLAKSFIQDCFNTFFASVLKDIRMERQKVRDTDNVRLFFLSQFLIEYMLILYHREQAEKKEKEKNDKGKQKAGEMPPAQVQEILLGYAVIMVEMDSVKWVFSRMRITMEDRPPAWVELQACINCFTQILLLLEAMSLSQLEDDVEAAEILQNSLYYNYDILDTSLTVVAQYKDQSIAYLSSIIHFAYVLLRMLEKYSKTKNFMFVRKRKAQRRKKKAAEEAAASGRPVPDAEDYAGSEGEADRDAPSYGEHQFKFKEFEMRFAQEAVVNTLLSYLQRWQQFDDPDQLKRVVGLIHRQIVKTQAEGLYFKVSALHLFQQILEKKALLPKTDGARDLLQMITFVLRKFFKKVQEDPFLIVEALTPKTKGKWKAISSYQSDESDSDGGGGLGRAGNKKTPAELEFVKKKNLSWSQQMEVVIAVLLKDGKQNLIEWIVENLEIAAAARTEIVMSTDGPPVMPTDELDGEEDAVDIGRRLAGPSKEAMDKFVQHDLDTDSAEKRGAVMTNAHFRLMLNLLAFKRSEEENIAEQKWFIPVEVLPSALQTTIGALKSYLANPPSLTEDAKSLLRRRRKQRRARTPLGSDEEADRPRRRKKQAETQAFKSAAFIQDSDDDEEADKAFFEMEKRLRAEMDAAAKAKGIGSLEAGLKKRKRDEMAKKKALARVMGLGGDEEDDVEEHEDEEDGEEEEVDVTSRKRQSSANSDDQQSSSDEARPTASRPPPRKRPSASRVVLEGSDEDEDVDMDSSQTAGVVKGVGPGSDEEDGDVDEDEDDDDDDDNASVGSIPVVRRRQMSASGSPASEARRARSHGSGEEEEDDAGASPAVTQKKVKSRRVVESDDE